MSSDPSGAGQPAPSATTKIPPGTRDVLPDEMRELRAITDAMLGVFHEAGYGEVYTPAAAKELNERGEKIRHRLNAICQREKVAFQFSGIGSMMTAHATSRPIKTAADIASGSQDAKELFFFDMMAAGIWIARRGFVALNIMIGEQEGDRFVAAVEEFVTARKALLQPK